MSVTAMLAEVRRMRRSLPSDADSPRARRLAFARSLYGEGHPALARLASAPDDPARIAEFRLDQFLAPPASLARSGGGTAAFRAFLDCPGAWTLRRLELNPDAPEPMQVPASPGCGLVIPHHDERFRPDPSRRGGPSRSIWLPPGQLSPPLLIYGVRPPDSLEESLWLAGQDDGLYLADLEAEDDTEAVGEFRWPGDAGRIAIKSEASVVSSRGFGEEWQTVGAIEKEGDA